MINFLLPHLIFVICQRLLQCITGESKPGKLKAPQNLKTINNASQFLGNWQKHRHFLKNLDICDIYKAVTVSEHYSA